MWFAGGLGGFGLSIYVLLLARSNFDHYARECEFGILKKKKNKKKTHTHTHTHKKKQARKMG